MQYADNISNQMSDMIGSDPNNNTVRSFYDNVYPPESATTDTSSSGISGLAQTASKSLRESLKQENQSPLGSFYGSPLSWAERISGFAQFFKGAPEKGNAYTDGFKKPQQNQPVQAVNPSEFYSKWYEGIRRFAEAEELANRGQTTVRTR